LLTVEDLHSLTPRSQTSKRRNRQETVATDFFSANNTFKQASAATFVKLVEGGHRSE
jgi:hypothetical protein